MLFCSHFFSPPYLNRTRPGTQQDDHAHLCTLHHLFVRDHAVHAYMYQHVTPRPADCKQSACWSVLNLCMVMQLGLSVISNLAASGEGAALLLKSSLLAKVEQQLHHLLPRRDGPRTAALLEPLVNLAAHAEGQKQLLRTASAPGQLPKPLCMLLPALQDSVPMGLVSDLSCPKPLYAASCHCDFDIAFSLPECLHIFLCNLKPLDNDLQYLCRGVAVLMLRSSPCPCLIGLQVRGT